MFQSQEVWEFFAHYSVIVAAVVIVWAVIEVVLMVVWLVRSKKLRKNLQNLIMMSSAARLPDENHVFIQSGGTSVIIDDESFYVRSDTYRLFGLRFGVLQTILIKKLHGRAREMIKIKEALE